MYNETSKISEGTTVSELLNIIFIEGENRTFVFNTTGNENYTNASKIFVITMDSFGCVNITLNVTEIIFPINHSKWEYNPTNYYLSGNFSKNMSDNNVSVYDVSTNASTYVYNITNNCIGTRIINIFQNQTKEWYSIYYIDNETYLNITDNQQQILNLSSGESRLSNITINLINISQTLVNWNITEDRTNIDFDINFTIGT
jgi:hypothetical protein